MYKCYLEKGVINMKRNKISFLIIFSFIIMMFSMTVSADQLNQGMYNFVCVDGGKYLNVYAGNDWDGVNVCVWDKDGSPEQNFKMVDRGGNRYVLYPSSSNGRVLDANRGNSYSNPLQAGNNIDIWQTNDAEAQEWYIDDRGGGKYTIELVHARGLVVTCDNPGSNGGNCSLQKYTGASNQLWYLQRTDGGSVKPENTTSAAPSNNTSTSSYKTGIYSVKYQGTNLRSGAGLDNGVVAVVNAGTELNVTSISGEWGKTNYDGKDCWIRLNGFADYVREATVSAPKPESTPAPETTRTGYVANTGGWVLRVRAGANTDSAVLGTLDEGSQITVKGDGKTNGFYKVDYNGRTGYCHGDFISFNKPSNGGNTNNQAKFTDVVNRVGCQTRKAYSNWDWMCGAYCVAYARSYLDNNTRYASEFWINNVGANWGAGGGSSSKCGNDSQVLASAKNSLDKGRPCVVTVNSSYGQHYVLAIYYSGSGSQISDFVVVDPWNGAIKSLGNYTINNWNKQIVTF